MLKVWVWLLVVSFVGFVASLMMDFFVDFSNAYGEVPIPGSERLHLPAGDVVVSFHAEAPGINEGERTDEMPIPQNLEMAITAPSGAAQPSVTEHLGGTTAVNSDAHRPVKVVHIPVAGDYTITTNGAPLNYSLDGRGYQFGSPRLSFGHDNPFKFLPWLFGGLCVLFAVAIPATVIRLALRTPSYAWTPTLGSELFGTLGSQLLASGQRVRGVLKSFAATGETMRSAGVTPSRPEFLDYPYYALVVELRFPNRAPVVGDNQQPVPPTEVPNLAIGRELNCAVDPADPANLFIVDWSYRGATVAGAAGSANPQNARTDFTQASGEPEHPPSGNSSLTVIRWRYGRRLRRSAGDRGARDDQRGD